MMRVGLNSEKQTRTQQNGYSVQVSATISEVLGYSGVLLLTTSNLLQIIVKASRFWNDLFTQFRADNASITSLLLAAFSYILGWSYKYYTGNCI